MSKGKDKDSATSAVYEYKVFVRWYVDGRRVKFGYDGACLPVVGEYLRSHRRRNGKVYVARYKVHTIEHVLHNDGKAKRYGYTAVRMTRLRFDREMEYRRKREEIPGKQG